MRDDERITQVRAAITVRAGRIDQRELGRRVAELEAVNVATAEVGRGEQRFPAESRLRGAVDHRGECRRHRNTDDQSCCTHNCERSFNPTRNVHAGPQMPVRRWPANAAPRSTAPNDAAQWVNDLTLRDTYSETALRRVWRCTHFCSSMTTMLHTSGEPYDEQLQQS